LDSEPNVVAILFVLDVIAAALVIFDVDVFILDDTELVDRVLALGLEGLLPTVLLGLIVAYPCRPLAAPPHLLGLAPQDLRLDVRVPRSHLALVGLQTQGVRPTTQLTRLLHLPLLRVLRSLWP